MSIPVIAILMMVFAAGSSASPADKDVTADTELLRDGVALGGVDGEVVEKGKGRWCFRFEHKFSDGANTIQAGTCLTLLASGTLQSMENSSRPGRTLQCRLWGRVTAYKQRNFIFPAHYLPTAPAAGRADEQSSWPAEPNINEPEDAVIIPEPVLERLRPGTRLKAAGPTEADQRQERLISGLSGIVVESASRGQLLFRPDGLGRGLQRESFVLLPCEALQQLQARRAANPQRLKFNVAGIATRYRQRDYLLLHRATRTYNYDNF